MNNFSKIGISLLSIYLVPVACKTSNPEQSTVKDLADGSSWCHSRLKADDQTQVDIDFQVAKGTAKPTWLNVNRTNQSEKIEAIVVPYKYPKNGDPSSAKVGTSFIVPLAFSTKDNKFTAQVPNGLPLVDPNTGDNFIYEFAFKIVKNGNDTYLVEPLSRGHNFRSNIKRINQDNMYICGDKPDFTKLKTPQAGSTDNDLDVEAVVYYMRMIKKKFYDTQTGYSVVNGAPPNFNEVIQCIANNPPYWSTLVQHFFCLHPSYGPVVPNMRGCFSYLAGSAAVNNRGFYPEIFDYCTYQDYDAVLGHREPFDVAKLVANKNAGNKIGVMKYLTAEEEVIFKYVNYTWYNPFAFKVSDQQAVLDQFWGFGKYKVNLSGKAVHTNPDILPFMKRVEANGGEVPWQGTKDVNGAVIPPPTPLPLLPTGTICFHLNGNVEISAPNPSTIELYYSRTNLSPPAWSMFNSTAKFDPNTNRWLMTWGNTNGYDLKFVVDGKDYPVDTSRSKLDICKQF